MPPMPAVQPSAKKADAQRPATICLPDAGRDSLAHRTRGTTRLRYGSYTANGATTA